MLISEYLRKKNDLMKEAIGEDIDLIPESQIEECKQVPLNAGSDVGCCPYCHVHYDSLYDCPSCPMAKAGNCCIAYSRIQPSYRMVKQVIRNKCDYQGINEVPGMGTLVEQYNKELLDMNDYGNMGLINN